jgi:hypothetical protein
MRRFVEGMDRGQSTLFPECLEDWICEDNPVRAIDVFVDELDLAELGFGGVDPEATGRPSLALSPIRDTHSEGFGALPGGTFTHWKAPPCHGAHPEPT